MALAATVTKQWYDGKKLFVILSIVPSGNYVSGGDTLNLSNLGIKSSQVPFDWDVISAATTAAQALNTYLFLPGATQATCKLRCFIGAVTELAAGAYPAAATGDVITATLNFELR